MCIRQLVALEFQSRRTDTRRTDTHFLLDPLDELHKLRHRIHAQQGQEPAIELESLILLAGTRQMEERDRLGGECIHKARSPTHAAGGDSFHDGVVPPEENAESVANKAANGGDTTKVGA